MGRAVFLPCCLTWGQTMVEVMEIMDFFQRVLCMHCCTQCPDLAAGHCWLTPLPETPEHSQIYLSQSLVGSMLLSPGSCCTQGSICALQECVSLVLCTFWQFYGGVNGDLLQEGLCHTPVCCTQSPFPCGRPWSLLSLETLKQSSGSDSVRSLGPGAHKVCLNPLSVSARWGVWF